MRWTRMMDYETGLDFPHVNHGTTPGTREGSERGHRALETMRTEVCNREFESKHPHLRGTTRIPSGTVVGPWKS